MSEERVIDRLCAEFSGFSVSASSIARQTILDACNGRDYIWGAGDQGVVDAIDNWGHTHHVELSSSVYYCSSGVRQNTPIIANAATSASDLLAYDIDCHTWSQAHHGTVYGIYDPSCGTCSTTASHRYKCVSILLGEHPCHDADTW